MEHPQKCSQNYYNYHIMVGRGGSVLFLASFRRCDSVLSTRYLEVNGCEALLGIMDEESSRCFLFLLFLLRGGPVKVKSHLDCSLAPIILILLSPVMTFLTVLSLPQCQVTKDFYPISSRIGSSCKFSPGVWKTRQCWPMC